MLIPEEIIVESWREKIASSVAFTRFMKANSISREPCLSEMSRTIRPRDLSWSETACLDSASTSPLGFAAREVEGLEDVRAHGCAYAAASEGAPSSRLSSSGVEERCSAIFWPILPSRTSPASAVSIVCIPTLAPVCRTE